VLDSAFLDLVECYGGSKDDRDLQNMVLTLYEFVQSHPWPDKWLKEKTDAFNLTDDTDFGSTAWGSVLKKSIRIDLWGLYNRMKKAVELIRVSPGLEPYLPNFEEETEGIRKLIESCDSVWDELYKTISRLGFKTLKRCGKDADKNIQDQVKNIRDSVKGAVKDMKDMIFAFDSESIIKDLRFQYPLIQALSRLVMNFQSKYSQKKRQRLLLDFNDLEHFCLQILTQRDPEGRIIPSAPALEYRERFREILVDEYQDSNLVQEVILSVISRKDTENPNVFMVGDVKQSIYRFRQARPELFMEKYHTYSQRKGSKNRKIKLFKNFRSRGEVINAVNFLFKQMMCENVGELEYDDEEALNLGASFEPLHGDEAEAGGPVELHIIDMDGDDLGYDGQNHEPADDEETEGENSEGYDQPEELLDDIQAEARLVAKRIQELISPGPSGKPFMIYDKRQGGYRSLEYRDIVVLLRTTRGWANVFMEEMASQGIPAYADTGTGYFQTVEVQTMMSLLQIIDNPMQDIPMLSVLRSPIASFTPEELIDIRLADRECSFYEAMKKAALGSDETARKTADFLSRLQSWRDKALYTPTDELIWYLYNDTGYYSYTGESPGGN
jgi:ATP-dependent helicase/nuclease subunit A